MTNPKMKSLTIGGVTYDTVGEASVTQVVGSGTKIATVSIDGTSTDLYAPSGGSTIDPATATPLADGTAAVGSSAKYAREDHVHPTDTSRLGGIYLDNGVEPVSVPVAAGTATINIGSGLSVSDSNNRATVSVNTGTTSGTVATGNHTHSGYQATLVSGTNIKTVNSTSLLGSGDITIAGLPSVTSSDNGKVLRVVSGAWAAASLPSASGVSF